MDEPLEARIKRVTDEIRETEDQLETLKADAESRDDVERLELLQQKLSSLLLESLQDSSNRLDSSVKTLNDTMVQIGKSSARLEYATILLLAVAVINALFSVGGPGDTVHMIFGLLTLVIVLLAIYLVLKIPKF